MEAEEELAKETVRAFTAALHGEEYTNPFTEAEAAAKVQDNAGERDPNASDEDQQ